ncbi:MAG: hypothetical protein AAGD96_33875 [Chloroflexota bacterium]
MPYSSLRADLITKQIEGLKNRIEERFPDRNLASVCRELLQVSETAQERANDISKPLYWVRVGLPLATITFLLALEGLYLLFASQIDGNATLNFADFLELSDSVFNLIVLFFAFLFFLTNLEQRIKRRRTLKELHQLRSLAHVIDMHQLTKDPEHTILGEGRHTPSTPEDSMSMFEITRYLDYCSEMLSLIGKIGALYVQEFDDEVAVAAVNEIEDLTTGLSRKIWQKIMYVHSIDLSLDEEHKGTIFNINAAELQLLQKNNITVNSQDSVEDNLNDQSQHNGTTVNSNTVEVESGD